MRLQMYCQITKRELKKKADSVLLWSYKEPDYHAKRNLKHALKRYVRESEYHPDIEKLRDRLSKVTDEQKLNILQQTKSEGHSTALHVAAYRGDAEMITTILSFLKPSDKLKVLYVKDYFGRTPHHTALAGEHKESMKAILVSLTADIQKKSKIHLDKAVMRKGVLARLRRVYDRGQKRVKSNGNLLTKVCIAKL